jgi:hypothetical protein
MVSEEVFNVLFRAYEYLNSRPYSFEKDIMLHYDARATPHIM